MKTFEEILRNLVLESLNKSTPMKSKLFVDISREDYIKRNEDSILNLYLDGGVVFEAMKQVHNQAVDLCASRVPPSQEEVGQNTSLSFVQKQGISSGVSRAAILEVKDMLK